jgi:hypothetical protein
MHGLGYGAPAPGGGYGHGAQPPPMPPHLQLYGSGVAGPPGGGARAYCAPAGGCRAVLHASPLASSLCAAAAQATAAGGCAQPQPLHAFAQHGGAPAGPGPQPQGGAQGQGPAGPR